MIDVQSQADGRCIALDKAGVKNILYPILVLDQANTQQNTVARINMYVNLPHRFKGTHMSRFIEILNAYRGEITMPSFMRILDEMRERLDAESAHMEMEFPYFVDKAAPVTGARGLLEYTCRFVGEVGPGRRDFRLGVDVPVTTLCPCSKEISDAGAHNQRARVTVTLRLKKFVWIEQIIGRVEAAGSAPVYSLLKRPDEKFVTEQAYHNPKFVEDIVRDVARDFEADPNIAWFAVEAENFESIHNHSAYAFVEKKGA